MISVCALFLATISSAISAPIPWRMLDLTYVLDHTTQNAPMYRKFEMKVPMNGTVDGHWLQYDEISSPTHMGTHVDAPAHFTPGGMSVDEIPVWRFITQAAIIDITYKSDHDRDAGVTIQDLLKWEMDNGDSLNGKFVVVRTGWGKYWNNRTAFFGTDSEDMKQLHHPGFYPETCRWLVDNRNANGVGTDASSFDRGMSILSECHQIMLPSGYFAVENLANLEQLPACGVILYISPLKLGKASGSPARVYATFAGTDAGSV